MTVNNAAYHHPTPLDTRFEPMSLPAMLERSVRANPDAPFLHFLGRTYSYKQIFAQAQAFALGLTLFLITFLLNIVALRVVKKYREAYD